MTIHFIHWFMFFTGSVLSVLLHAECSVYARSNSVTSLQQWFQLNRNTIKVRGVLQFLIMLAWYGAPELLGDIVRVQVPMTAANCALVAFAMDNFWHGVGFRYLGQDREMPIEAPPGEGGK